jgi:nicotinate-nucleotide adenylyltransferase
MQQHEHGNQGSASPRVGLLGGTFDPVHLAHLRLGEEAAEQLGLDRVLFVLAPRPWRKAGREITPTPQRLAMLELALRDNPRFAVSTVELGRDGPTYTADTLLALHGDLDPIELTFILGADALADLPNWDRPDQIVRLAQLAVAARSGQRLPNRSELEARVPGLGGVLRVRMPRLAISSTEIRRKTAAGRSIRYLVPDAVAAYIAEQRLYH